MQRGGTEERYNSQRKKRLWTRTFLYTVHTLYTVTMRCVDPFRVSYWLILCARKNKNKKADATRISIKLGNHFLNARLSELFHVSLESCIVIIFLFCPSPLVVYHHGKNAWGGHYTSDVCHPTHGWIRADDTRLKVVPFNYVLKPTQGKDPYMLFYRRIDLMP